MTATMTTFRSLFIRFLRSFLALSVLASVAIAQADTSFSDPSRVQNYYAEGQGVSGQLLVADEIRSAEMTDDLVYTITSEPRHGQVGLAGGAARDIFENKTSNLGYFAYRPDVEYEGVDSFSYEVRNRTNGLVFANEVVIDVTPAEPLLMDSFEVSVDQERLIKAVAVILQTRPNLPISHQLPNHEDFMPVADRATIADAQIAYAIDEYDKPSHGTARLDRSTGELSYAPDPNFIGEDRFVYYTIDQNNPELGVENEVIITVEPIRTPRTKTVDRSSSREVDLVFVINNSKSMAPHQSRIADNLQRFRQLFDERDLDYRIGVLTTDFVDSGSQRAKRVRSNQLDASGQLILRANGKPRRTTKQVASNGRLVTLDVMPDSWITPDTPDGIFAELVRVGTNGSSNRTAFTSMYNFVAGAYNGQHDLLRPAATTIVVYFMDEEETRMATWRTGRDGDRQAEWVQNGTLPELLEDFNRKNPDNRQTLDGYINYWVLRPFIIVKGNQRGKIQMHAVVSPDNISHRRAAELTGGSVLNIESDFSTDLAALGDRIADTVAVALDPTEIGATVYQPSLRVLVDGREIASDPNDGWVYDASNHSIRFEGPAKKQAFAAVIEISYEEHK